MVRVYIICLIGRSIIYTAEMAMAMMMMTTATATAATATEIPKTISLMKPSLRQKLSPKVFSVKASSVSASASVEVEFDPKIPIEKALTPPSSWYSLPSFYSFELDRIFYRGWQVVGCTEEIKDPGDYFTGRLGSIEFVVCRDDDGKVHAFHNVCRHHASLLAYGSGKKTGFACPYHGWTYGLNGPLLKATRITGIQNFNVNEFGLIPIQVAIWGPFVLLNMEQKVTNDVDDVANEWLGSASEILSTNGVDSSLSYICRREYTIECNWKVFCDNYLDGGYHVPFAHKGLANGLKLDSYSTTVRFTALSLLWYGPWMDTNLVIRLGPRKCQVVFDYFLEPSLKDDKDFIERSLQDSERVQMEDVVLCEGVQRGLESPAYSFGRYSPRVENAMHHFHCLLHSSLKEE